MADKEPRAHAAWSVLATEAALEVPGRLRVNRERVRLPDGREIPDFYRIALHDYALVYATTADGDVLMFRQYKHGPQAVCLSFPGGHVEPGEDPQAAASRELLQETGYMAAAWTPLGAFTVDANQECATAYFFRADGCRLERAPDSGDLEEMELVRVPSAELARPERLREMRLVSHVALALLASR